MDVFDLHQKPTALSKKHQFLAFILIISAACILPLIIYPKIITQTYKSSVYILLDLNYYCKTVFLYGLSFLMLLVLYIFMKKYRLEVKINVFLLLFVIWCLASALVSPHKKVAFYGWATRWQGFFTYVCYFVLFLFVAAVFQKSSISHFLTCLFASGAIVSVHSLLQYYGIYPESYIIKYDGVKRISATIGNRNFLGSYMVILTLTSLFYYLKNSKKSFVLFATSILFYCGLLASLTRGAWLGTLAAGIFTLALLAKDIKIIYKKLVIIAASFILATVVLNVTSDMKISQRYENLKEQASINNQADLLHFGSGRFFIYKKTFEIIVDKPIFGTGPDCLGFYTELTDMESEKYFGSSETICIDKAHSEYLEYAATMGIPALILYTSFVFSIFVPFLKGIRKRTPMETGIFAGWLGYLAQAAVNIGVISVLPIFFIFSAILWKFRIPEYPL